MRNGLIVFALWTSLNQAACGASAGDCTSCNGGSIATGSLDGSYCEDVEMTFCEVRVRRQDKSGGTGYFLKIDWYTPGEMGSGEKALYLQFDASNVVIEPNVEIDFIGQNGSLGRLQSEGPMTLTGDVTQAMTRISFDSFTGEIGSNASGRLNVLFTKSGRTLTGTFNNSIVDASLPGNQ